MARYLVTGGAGFIGSHLVGELLRAGHEVRVLDDYSTGTRRNLIASDVELIAGDIRDRELVLGASAGVEGIFHLAAMGSVPRSFRDPAGTFSVNVEGTAAVMAAAGAAGVQRLVYASSSSVYGGSKGEVRRETDSPAPLSPYATSKLDAEKLIVRESKINGVEVARLRYFNVYGPRQDPSSQYAAAIPLFICSLLDGVSPQIYGDGEQTRDFTYVGDVVAGTIAAMMSPEAAERVMNIGTGRRTSVNQLVETIAQLVGIKIEPEYLPARPGDVRHSVADVTLARTFMKYGSRWMLRDGLGETIAWQRGLQEVRAS